MQRIVLGVVGGFIGWLIVWVGVEKGLSAIWPAFGVNQRACGHRNGLPINSAEYPERFAFGLTPGANGVECPFP
jgi:hypothetical protein